MTRGPRPTFPHTIVLPTALTIDAAGLREAFGRSRGVIHLWRKLYGLPAPSRVGNASLSRTAEIVRWCSSHNIVVIWV